MAIPTISGVSPAVVWTGGQMVTIAGTNFRTATIPTYYLAGPYPPAKPSMRVTVDGVEAKNVRVTSAGSLTCILREHEPGAGAISVQNLDDDGAPIAGEVVTLPAAVSFKRPDLTKAPDFLRVHRELIHMLKRQVIENVVTFQNVDWGTPPYDVAGLASVPALVIGLPDTANTVGARRSLADIYARTSDTTFEHRRRPRKLDLRYSMTVVAKTQGQWLALQEAIRMFFAVNTKVEVLRDPQDSGKGAIAYDLAMPLEEQFRDTSTPNKDGIVSFDGSFTISGVDLEELAGFPGQGVLDTGGTAEQIVIGTTRI